jgi:ketosteroid isomerase-like protein
MEKSINGMTLIFDELDFQYVISELMVKKCKKMNIRHCFWTLLVIVCFNQGFAQMPKSTDREAVLNIMQRQEDHWNQGDLAGFMKGYWESDSLVFIGKSGLTYGYAPTLANYKRSYPDVSAMGKLTFTILRIDAIGKKAMQVTGKWLLTREKDSPQGHFTLLWRKIKGQWVIVADHSS